MTLTILGGLPGLLNESEIRATSDHLVNLQLPSGQIPWYLGGHCDPWNHVESAMALTITGRLAEAQAAYDWLARLQMQDGSWFNYYVGDRVKDARLDTNVCAYIGAGVYHYLLATNDVDQVATWWPMVERAIDFVLSWAQSDGTIRWSLDATGRAEHYALLTGSSSIYHSVMSAVAVSERLGIAKPEWELAAGRLGHVVAHHPGAFAPKNEYAMDWYYPIFGGALRGDGAQKRLADGWERHVMDGLGVRCVSTHDWVTAAETAELALTLEGAGETTKALDIFSCTMRHRREDGSYFTGIAYPEHVTYPDQETTSYTAAAVLLAVDALTSATPAGDLFRHSFLPTSIDLAEADCPLHP